MARGPNSARKHPEEKAQLDAMLGNCQQTAFETLRVPAREYVIGRES